MGSITLVTKKVSIWKYKDALLVMDGVEKQFCTVKMSH